MLDCSHLQHAIGSVRVLDVKSSPGQGMGYASWSNRVVCSHHLFPMLLAQDNRLLGISGKSFPASNSTRFPATGVSNSAILVSLAFWALSLLRCANASRAAMTAGLLLTVPVAAVSSAHNAFTMRYFVRTRSLAIESNAGSA